MIWWLRALGWVVAQSPRPPWESNLFCVSQRPEYHPMLENRNHAQPRRTAVPREFFLPVEVYISNQAAAALRKVSFT
jgi:hypothetical protein